MIQHYVSRVAISIGFTLLFSSVAQCHPFRLAQQAQDSAEKTTRTWRDASGKFEIEATLESHDKNEVVLLTEAGKEVRVKVSQLSDEDLKYLKTLDKKSNSKDKTAESSKKDRAKKDKAASGESESDPELIAALKEKTTEFYNNLRTAERALAMELLTPAARKLAKAKKSGFNSLPKPDEGKQSIKVGKPTINEKVASVPVTVRSNQIVNKTKLYFSKDDQENWSVAAIGLLVKNKENKINFEESTKEEEKDSIASLVGQPIDLTGLTLDGSPVSLKSFKGKVVLIDFWATWCGPCIGEIPNIKENYDKYHKDGFEVLAVSTDQDMKELLDFVKEENPPWIVLADRHPMNKDSMARKFGITGIPAFILVDRDGKVCAVNCRGKSLGKKLEELFGNNGKSGSE